jgi:hypothetical protein
MFVIPSSYLIFSIPFSDPCLDFLILPLNFYSSSYFFSYFALKIFFFHILPFFPFRTNKQRQYAMEKEKSHLFVIVVVVVIMTVVVICLYFPSLPSSNTCGYD